MTGAAILAHASAFPGKNGKIVYRSFDIAGFDGSNHLHSINPDGGGDQDLTPTSPGIPLNNNNEPAVSPDGTKLAFSSDRDHGFNLQTEIYVMNMDGTGLQRLTLSPQGASQPTWSPDGKRIAFTWGNTISAINADGTGQAVIFSDPSFRLPNPKPSWSPDGTTIAFAANGPDSVGRIYLVNPDGTGMHSITSGQDSAPTWSPDGTALAFASVRNGGGEIFTVTTAGIESGPIVRISDGGGANPAWSPDGAQIVHEGNDPSGSPHGIFVYDLASGARTVVTSGQVSQPTWGPAPPPADVTPPVTTAGVSTLPNAAGWNNTDVTVTLTATDNPGGSGVQRITFSGAGAQIIPATSVTGPTASVLVAAEGSTTVSYFATDLAGNAEAPKHLTVSIDRTPPSVSTTLSPAPNVNGWNNTDVTATFSATDALSGVASVSGPLVYTNEGRGQFVNGGATDWAGNTGISGATVNIDKTAPEVYVQFDPADQHVLLFARDSLSGTSWPPALLTPGTHDYFVPDRAGNTLVVRAALQNIGPQFYVNVVAVQYNGGPISAVAPNEEDFVVIGSIVGQSIRLNGAAGSQVSALYTAGSDTTVIFREFGGPITRPGLVLLKLATDHGNLVVEY